MAQIYSFEPIWNEWKIDDEIGHGSFGAVYAAHRDDTISGITQVAAVKHISIPSKATADDEYISTKSMKEYYTNQLSMLVREINAMIELRGKPNIVSYEEHRIIPKPDGLGYDLFLRMEKLTSLTAWIRSLNRPLTETEIIRLGCDIAHALQVMQARKYIHRDIKPANIFIDKDGDFKLGDFGTARVLQSEGSASTQTGTPNYMAPEIYRGEQNYDQTVDMYSLGIVLYRYLNDGLLPLMNPQNPDTQDAVLRRVRGEQIPPPKNASPALAAIVMRCIAFQPAERFQTAQELRRALEDVLNGKNTEPAPQWNATQPPVPHQTQPARPVQPAAQAKQPRQPLPQPEPVPQNPPAAAGGDKKKPPVLIIAIVAAVVVIGIVVALVSGGKKPAPAPTAAPVVATEAPTAEPTEAPTAEPTEAPTAEPTEVPTAEPTEAPAASHWVTLKIDSKDAETDGHVTEVQNRLMELGYQKWEGTGNYVAGTKAAVTAFQQNAGLPVTGNVDEETYKALMAADAPAVTPVPTEEPVVTPEPTAEPTATPEPTPAPTEVPEPTATPDSRIHAGSVITLGNYNQGSDGAEQPVEWIVLDVRRFGDDVEALVVSKNVLAARVYHATSDNVTWETSSLREWLNEDFLDQLLNETEQKAVIANGSEKLSLLTVADLDKYMPDNESRVGQLTPWAAGRAAAMGVSVQNNTCGWWLSSEGSNGVYMSQVSRQGAVLEGRVDSSSGIRPSMWVDLGLLGLE